MEKGKIAGIRTPKPLNPMQITIHEIRHFTLMTELLTFTGWAKKVILLIHYTTLYERYHFFGPPCTIYFAFLCKPIWGNASVSRYYRFPCPDIFWGTASPQKYLDERCSPVFHRKWCHLRRLLFSTP